MLTYHTPINVEGTSNSLVCIFSASIKSKYNYKHQFRYIANIFIL